MKPHRIGRFFISRDLVVEYPEIVRALFHELDPIVVEARFRYDLNEIEYMALSPKFAEVEGAGPAPLYPVDSTYEEKFITHAHDGVPYGATGPDDYRRRVEITKLTLGKVGEDPKDIHIPIPF